MTNNQKVRCGVVDDEPLAVELLTDYILKAPGLEMVFHTTKVLEALHLVQEGKVDLLFLDIQMPDLNGIQFMKIIRNKCKVVLSTAYQQYAVESYEHEVVDYLLKPVTLERFMTAVRKARESLGTHPPIAPLVDHIFIKTEYRLQKLDLASIYYIEALRDYMAFHTTEGKFLSLESMRNIESVLPGHCFIRVHKSYIVNKDRIGFIERGKVIINNQYIPVGDTYREKLMMHIRVV